MNGHTHTKGENKCNETNIFLSFSADMKFEPEKILVFLSSSLRVFVCVFSFGIRDETRWWQWLTFCLFIAMILVLSHTDHTSVDSTIARTKKKEKVTSIYTFLVFFSRKNFSLICSYLYEILSFVIFYEYLKCENACTCLWHEKCADYFILWIVLCRLSDFWLCVVIYTWFCLFMGIKLWLFSCQFIPFGLDVNRRKWTKRMENTRSFRV